MGNTFKHKVRHIFYNNDGKPNLRVPFKVRWSYLNHIRRHNCDRGEDRALLAKHRDQIIKSDMTQQIKDYERF